MTKFKGGEPYRLQRRIKKKGGNEQLSGYALDITIRVNGQGAHFLQDHNSDRNVMPHNNREELTETLLSELDRNYSEHFGTPQALVNAPWLHRMLQEIGC